MELAEMKILWEDMSEQLEKQRLLTDKLVRDMIEERYRNKLGGLWNMEAAGTVFCFGFAIFIIVNFQKYDTWYIWASAIFSVLHLILMPSLVLYYLDRMRRVDIGGNDVRQTLLEFSKAKKGFHFVTQLAMGLNFILLFTVSIMAIVIFKDGEALTERTTWLWMMPFGFVLLFLFSRWGYRCYVGVTNSAEGVLRELDAS